MIKAHSLLYAIYVCLIVSIICGALLYFSSLYGQLNTYYNLQEELYISNQSAVNYALGHQVKIEEVPDDEHSGIKSNYQSKEYGLLTLLLTQSSLRNDTVTSAHFVGYYNHTKEAVYLSRLSKPISYFGRVKLVGEFYLPSESIQPSYIANQPNELTFLGKKNISEVLLPEINPTFKKVFQKMNNQKAFLSTIEKQKDSLYYNSFFKETKEVYFSNPVVSNLHFKGNFVLRGKDSLYIKKNVTLEDVILMAPKIIFETGFVGTVQVFATQSIALENKVTLNYPSVLCVYNEGLEESKIKIDKECSIKGAVVLFGNSFALLENNTIEIAENGLIIGSVYCSGKLDLKSDVYGSVYTNRFFYSKKPSSYYDNMIANIEINSVKCPNYFIAIPLFETKKYEYAVIKKVL